jgi:protein SCO1/2
MRWHVSSPAPWPLALGVLAALALGAGLGVEPARAVAPLGPEFDGVEVRNKLGDKVGTDIPFTDPSGKTVSLGDYLDGQRPVLLTLNFYRCTSICSAHLNALVKSLSQAGWAPGAETFRIVTVSFDPRDTQEIAAGKQQTYREELVRRLAEEDDEELEPAEVTRRAAEIDWTFLVGDDRSIRTLLDNVGYTVKYDERTEQFAHSPVTYVLSLDGKINRYLWGIDIPSRDLRFALMESSDGELGSFGEKILLSCFDYNRDHGGYEAFAWGFMRIGGLLVLLALGAFLLVHWRRERRRAATNPSPSGLAPRPSSPSESRP